MRVFSARTKVITQSSSGSRSPTLVLQRNQIRHMSTGTPKATYWAKEEGNKNSTDYRVYFHTSLANKEGGRISPWHDISLLHFPADGSAPAKDVVNMVVEIPKGETAKYEVSKKEDLNPIKQDTRDGAPRFLKHSPMPASYGLLPQTWADPKVFPLNAVKYPGDNDPVDVIDLSELPTKVGDVVPVKILGTLCLIDQGEADWKVIAINVNDPKAKELHDSLDVEIKLTKSLNEIREWFRVYKVAEGKQENSYAFDGKLLDKATTTEVIMNTTHSWLKLHSFQPTELGFTYTEHNKDLHFL